MNKDTEVLLGVTEIPAEIEEYKYLVVPIQVVDFFPL